jgi:hypothetical protein
MNDKEMELIEEKYGKLIHKIGHWISGDNAIAGHEDNTQDIWIAAMEAIRGYSKKENQTFDEFWGSKGFDKYIKTCLWNVKNSKGAKITKRYPLTKGTVDVFECEEVLQMNDKEDSSADMAFLIDDLSNLLTDTEANAVKVLVEDPSYIKATGKANINALSRTLGKTWNDTSKIVMSIQTKLRNEL